jgi:hypothetical protein
LRETQISQFYRYAKISQLLEADQFCRYVAELTGFSNAKLVVIFAIYAIQPNFTRSPDIVVCYPLKDPPEYV